MVVGLNWTLIDDGLTSSTCASRLARSCAVVKSATVLLERVAPGADLAGHLRLERLLEVGRLGQAQREERNGQLGGPEPACATCPSWLASWFSIPRTASGPTVVKFCQPEKPWNETAGAVVARLLELIVKVPEADCAAEGRAGAAA